MSAFQGMDPVIMHGVADRLRTQAAQLEDVLSSVQRSVDEAISLWDGEDAHGFNGWWGSHYRPAISAAHTSLVEAAEALERNVREQERASGIGSSGGSGGLRPEAVTPDSLLDFAASAYGADKTLPDGWSDVSVKDLERMGLESPPYYFEVKGDHVIIHTLNGMDARLMTDGRGNYVLSFAGTTGSFFDGIDWHQNYQTSISTLTAAQLGSQGEDAANLAYALRGDIDANHMVITGHSLGGRNAALASLVTGAPAVTYNSAGVTSEDVLYAQSLGGHSQNIGQYALSVFSFGASDRLTVDDSRITNYFTSNDPLTLAQTVLPLHNALGNQIKVETHSHIPTGHGLEQFKDRLGPPKGGGRGW